MEQSSAIRFWRHGEFVDVRDVPATTTVLDWLRRDPHSRGAKEGCNEGDCGSCTVVIADIDPTAAPALLRWRTVNACLTLLPMLDGCALFTVEDVAWTNGGRLHPIQQAVVDDHATQCGFCTPGVVMSLWCLYQQAAASGAPTGRAEISTALAGNLCRCTGYRSILDAGVSALDSPGVPFDADALLAELIDARHDRTFRYGTDPGTLFVAPRSIAEFARLVRESPGATVIAGGTDLTPGQERPEQADRTLIWTAHVREMAAISTSAAGLRIGGAVTLEDAWAALSARVPTLAQAWTRFAGPAIRHMGTMAGNLVTASPVGDSAPVLMALDASVEIRRGRTVRIVPVEHFSTGYRQTCLGAGEFVAAIEVPASSLGRDIHAYKLSKRFDSDIAAVSAAMWVALNDDAIADVRIAFGGMAATVVRARHVEAALLGRAWTDETLAAAQLALVDDVAPMSDHRGAAEYRMTAARGLLRRFWLQTRPDHPLSRAQTEIWSHA